MSQEEINEKQFKNFYNQNSGDIYTKFIYHLQEKIKGIDVKDKTILEVGCGKGFVSLWLASLGGAKEVVALDESEGIGSEKGVLAFSENTVKDFDIKNIKVVKSDIMKNSFPDNSFDIIIANNALHHVIEGGYISRNPTTKSQYIRLFSELRRLLKPNGTLVLGEFSRRSIWRYIKLRYRQIDWEIHPTLKEWILVIKLAGFRKTNFKYTGPYILRRFELLLSNPVSQSLISPTFNIYAQK